MYTAGGGGGGYFVNFFYEFETKNNTVQHFKDKVVNLNTKKRNR